MGRKMKAIKCEVCEINFTPGSSMQKLCSPECRFRAIMASFETCQACWIWPLSLGGHGYGQFNYCARPLKLVYAHRLSYELTYGAIPDGMWILHKCDNPACFNPSHLFLGEPSANSIDMTLKDRAPNIKITNEDVLKIKAMRTAHTITELAMRFGVSRTTIKYALKVRYNRIKNHGKAPLCK